MLTLTALMYPEEVTVNRIDDFSPFQQLVFVIPLERHSSRLYSARRTRTGSSMKLETLLDYGRPMK